jgi:hypothetical protein
MGCDKNNEKNHNDLIMPLTSVSPVLGACGQLLDRHAKQPSAMAAIVKSKPLGWMIP